MAQMSVIADIATRKANEDTLERRVEELEQELKEARQVIFGDNTYNDTSHWTAVERAREIELELKRLEPDQLT
jgi:hypothetical protein